MNDIKPLLPNGYKIKDTEIKWRLNIDNTIEIYSLANSYYLNIILNNKLNILSEKIEEYNIFELKIKNILYKVFISKENFENKTKLIIDTLITRTGLDSVVGMKELKQQLYKDIIIPLSKSDDYEKFKLTIPNGILLYGPPGCGKTYIVRKLAEEIKYKYFELKHSDFASSYIHGVIIKIAEIFNKAKAQSPSLIFIDELDGLLPNRVDLAGHESYKREEINEFLMHLNDAGKNKILVISATNQIELIDKAVLRSGRFDKKIYVPPPDFDARKHLFEFYLGERPQKNIDFDSLSKQTNNYSCSDIELIVNEASRTAVNLELNYINNDLLLETITKIPSSINNIYKLE